jgi:hypothetical protein
MYYIYKGSHTSFEPEEVKKEAWTHTHTYRLCDASLKIMLIMFTHTLRDFGLQTYHQLHRAKTSTTQLTEVY